MTTSEDPKNPVMEEISEELSKLKANEEPEVVYPLRVAYCGECTLPIEYCDYSGKAEKCKKWLEGNMPDLAPGSKPQVDDQNAQNQSAAPNSENPDATTGSDEKKTKRGGKGLIKPDKSEKSKSKPTKITLKTATRSKNKSVTIVKGLASHGIDLKTASKFFSSKFACGCSVPDKDELVIQGDVKDKLFAIIPEKWSQIDENNIEDLDD